MADPIFDRQIQMIEAGDRRDFDTVNKLVAEDSYLHAFGNYLHSMMRHGPEVIEKSLSLPNLDRDKPPFERVISNMIVHAAHHGDAGVLEAVLKYSKKPADDSSEALKSLFNRLAEKAGSERPSTEIGQILLRNGAHVDEAIVQPAQRLSGRAAEVQQLREQFDDFKRRLSRGEPEAPPAETPIPALPVEAEKPNPFKKLLSKLRFGQK